MTSEWPKGPFEPWKQKIERDALGKSIDGQGERPQVSESERLRMDKEIVVLGKLMKDAGIWWQIDGTLNISLRKKAIGGDYVGIHSDVDISVLRNELPRLAEHLQQNGYGMFLRSKDGTLRTYRRTGHEVFSRKPSDEGDESPYILAIDEQGNIRTDADLVRMQVSVVDLNEQGLPTERGITYPASWLQGKASSLQGVPLMLSHPARHALFKIWYDRVYDESDIQELANLALLSTEDVDQLEYLALNAVNDSAWKRANPRLVHDPQIIKRRIAYFRTART